MTIGWKDYQITIRKRLNISLLTRLLVILHLVDCLFAFKLASDSYDQSIAYNLLPTGEKRELQTHLLNLLGLDHRPKPKRKELLSSIYLKDIYQSFSNEESVEVPSSFGGSDEFFSQPIVKAINESEVIVSFVNANYDHSNGCNFVLNRESRLWFNTAEIAPGSKVFGAELKLYKYEALSPANLIFDLYKIYLYLITNDANKKLRLIESKTFSHKSGWLMFNVTGVVQDWIDIPENNFGLYMTIHSISSGKEVLPESVGLIGSKGAKDKQPFIFTFFESQSHLIHRRRRREVTKSEEVTTYKPHNPFYDFAEFVSGQSCQKKSLFVSFKDLGWQDWIIAPDGYPASFCDGECSFPLNAQMNATNHAIVQTLVHLMDPNSVPKASCAPTKLSSIMVLYFDDNSNVILKKYRNMTVKTCGCH